MSHKSTVAITLAVIIGMSIIWVCIITWMNNTFVESTESDCHCLDTVYISKPTIIMTVRDTCE